MCHQCNCNCNEEILESAISRVEEWKELDDFLYGACKQFLRTLDLDNVRYQLEHCITMNWNFKSENGVTTTSKIRTYSFCGVELEEYDGGELYAEYEMSMNWMVEKELPYYLSLIIEKFFYDRIYS